MVSLLRQHDFQGLRKIPFCYLCGREFAAHDSRNRDHVPPECIFAPPDREPLLLPAHKACNKSYELLDEKIGQLIALRYGKVPADPRHQLRTVVFERLRLQFTESGACRPSAEIKLCLACGRIASDADRAGLHKHFAEKGWGLWDEPWLRERLGRMSDQGYENQVSAVVAKLLLRGRVE
jgi:hypothetical protein